MNLKRYAGLTAMCIFAACIQTATAGSPATPNQAQDQAKVEESIRVENQTAVTLAVMHGTVRQDLASGKSIDLPISDKGITVARINSTGTISQLGLQFAPGNCPLPLKVCLVVH